MLSKYISRNRPTIWRKRIKSIFHHAVSNVSSLQPSLKIRCEESEEQFTKRHRSKMFLNVFNSSLVCSRAISTCNILKYVGSKICMLHNSAKAPVSQGSKNAVCNFEGFRSSFWTVQIPLQDEADFQTKSVDCLFADDKSEPFNLEEQPFGKFT